MEKQITLPATISNIEAVTAFVEEELELHECPMKTVVQIDVVIDEIVSNIVNYAYGDAQGDFEVRLEVLDDERTIKMSFEDSGIAYNPLEAEEPDISLSAEERKVGGLGVFIVKKTMDEVKYCYENGKNILSVLKRY